MKSFGQRWGTWVEEILGGDMVERRSVVGRVGTEKGTDHQVAWDDDIFCDHGVPLSIEVREGNGPKWLFGIWCTFVGKNEAPLKGMIQVAFVEGALMVNYDFGVTFQNVGHAVKGVCGS
jgi:hypothetical protein